jgi:hypothetical protein
VAEDALDPEDPEDTLPYMREEQWDRLRGLKLSPEDTARVWESVVKPLIRGIERRTIWPRGRCRRCGVPHPEWVGPGRKFTGHHTWCPRYVGPLRHAEHMGPHGLFHDQVTCLCGKRYAMYRDDVEEQSGPRVRNECPDKELDWRGPTNDEG